MNKNYDETNGNELFYVSDIIDFIVMVLCTIFPGHKLLSAYHRWKKRNEVEMYGRSPIVGIVNRHGRQCIIGDYLNDPSIGLETLTKDLDKDKFRKSI